MNKIVKVLRGAEIIKTYEVEVDTTTLDVVLDSVQKAIYLHSACVFEDAFFGKKPEITERHKEFADMNVKYAITGGAVTDILLGKSMKDIDVLITHSKAEDKEVAWCEEGYPTDFRFFNYEGISETLAQTYGFLNRPYCYSALERNRNFIVYKTQDEKIDFLLHDTWFEPKENSVYETVMREYDQDIKLGIYNGEFIISEEMYNAMNSGVVRLNKNISKPTEKELDRLQRANAKYFGGNDEPYFSVREGCPECGGLIIDEEITSSNPGAMTYCTSCNYRMNQFLTWEDFKEMDEQEKTNKQEQSPSFEELMDLTIERTAFDLALDF